MVIAMKYPLSKLKHHLNELGVFDIRFLNFVNNDYNNEFDLIASQWISGSEIKHKIYALTMKEGLSILLNRAEKFKSLLEETKESKYNKPDISKRNMVGHISDGNVDFIDDYCTDT